MRKEERGEKEKEEKEEKEKGKEERGIRLSNSSAIAYKSLTLALPLYNPVRKHTTKHKPHNPHKHTTQHNTNTRPNTNTQTHNTKKQKSELEVQGFEPWT